MKRRAVKRAFVALSGALLLLACAYLVHRLQGRGQIETSPLGGEQEAATTSRMAKAEEGRQLYAFKTYQESGSFAVILPGNSVDIVCVPHDPVSGERLPGAYVVFRKVKVVASRGPDLGWTSLTFNLTKEQAAEVSLAENRGDLRFLLVRGPD